MSRFGAMVRRVDERIPGVDLPLLSVSQTRGILRRSELTDKPPRAESLDEYKICRVGDIIFNKMSIRAGAVGIAKEDGLVTYHYEVMRPHASADARYLTYLLKSDWFISELVRRERGIGAGDQVNVRTTEVPFSVLRTVDAHLPTSQSQRQIADYLDRETAQIDALIGKQERLIETLRERRSTVVAHEFLAVPADRLQLRRLTRLLTSGSRDWGDYYADQGVRFLRIGNLPRADLRLRGEVQYVNLPETASKNDRARLQKGDLLFSITAYLGSVAVVDERWNGAYVSQHVALCRLDDTRVESSFLGWFMMTPEGQDQLKQGAAGGTKQQLALPDIRELRVPLPSQDDQRRIIVRIEQQLTQIDELIAKAEQLITLSRERRYALITAAVTGQIDVRAAS